MLNDLRKIVEVQGRVNAAIRQNALFDNEAAAARDNKVRFGQVDIVLAVATFVGDFENIAKTLGGDDRRLGSASLYQRVGRKGCAMNESNDLCQVCVGFGQYVANAFQRTDRWIVGRCRGLCRRAYSVLVIDQNRIGKGAANIYGNAWG